MDWNVEYSVGIHELDEQHIPGHDRPYAFHFLRRSALSTHPT